MQGGPHDHTTAAKAVCFGEALKPEFASYAAQIIKNAKVLGEELVKLGWKLITGGTDTHLLLADLTPFNLPGKLAEAALDKAGITVNKNTVPYDPRSPFDPSGIRFGTPAMTTRGMKETEMRQVAKWMDEVAKNHADEKVLARVKEEVKGMCAKFPVPGIKI